MPALARLLTCSGKAIEVAILWWSSCVRFFFATYLIWSLAGTLIPTLDSLGRDQTGVAPELADLEPFHYSILEFQYDALSHVLRRDLLALETSPSSIESQALIREFEQNKRDMQEAAEAYILASDLMAFLSMEEARVDFQRAEKKLRETQWATERAVQAEVSGEIVRSGIAGPGGPLPPVWFRLAHPPLAITFSPREEIQPVASYFLREDTPMAKIEAFEKDVLQHQNLSAFVEKTGGVATFPTTVAASIPTLQTLFEVVAHEWIHNYLTFKPLGVRYLKSTSHRTLNETAASIVGEEISRRLMLRHYRDLYLPDAHPENPPEEVQPSICLLELATASQRETFDFEAALRETRMQVDAMLEAGLVEEAETYMEERRRLINAEGYNLRKLNQAYFAFHGTYATGPGSTSEIGPQMETLRSLSPSLKEFVKTVQDLRNEEDLSRALTQARARSDNSSID